MERVFRVLQARFAFIRHAARLWDDDELGAIMRTCLILNNMIIEDERDLGEGEERASDTFYGGASNDFVRIRNQAGYNFDNFVDVYCHKI